MSCNLDLISTNFAIMSFDLDMVLGIKIKNREYQEDHNWINQTIFQKKSTWKF